MNARRLNDTSTKPKHFQQKKQFQQTLKSPDSVKPRAIGVFLLRAVHRPGQASDTYTLSGQLPDTQGPNMNYQPFSDIAAGNIFHLVDNTEVQLMKLGKDSAVLLHGYWKNDQLYSRGTVIPMKLDVCVVALTEGEVTLTYEKVDPIDPRRKFWKEGEFKLIGQNTRGKVNFFPGLFLYHGFGVGNYYSATGEVFWGRPSDGKERAAAEGIPFVYYDTFQWTSDPELKRERADAQRTFDRAKAEEEKAAAFAVAETA
jgi:hypothetical protein